jgi:hypothetical protein
MATSARTTVETHLGAKAQALLDFHSPKIPKERLPTSGSRFYRPRLDRVGSNIRVLSQSAASMEHGRLGKTAISRYSVDQGVSTLWASRKTRTTSTRKTS